MTANGISYSSLGATSQSTNIFQLDTEVRLLEKQLRALALEEGPQDTWSKHHVEVEERIRILKDQRREKFFRHHAHRPQIATDAFESSQESTSSTAIFSSQESLHPVPSPGHFIPFNNLDQEHPTRLDEEDTDGYSGPIPSCLLKQSAQQISCEDKKRLQHILEEMFAQAIPKNGSEERCWLYKGPEAECGKAMVVTSFKWRDEKYPGRSMCLRQQVGTWWMIVKNIMTAEQQYGYLYESWHLSHLCGNWQCINPAHHTMEPGPINLDRRMCHHGGRPPYGCEHLPGCLFHYKDGKPRGINTRKLPKRQRRYHQQTLSFDKSTNRISTESAKITSGMGRRRKDKDKAFGKDRASTWKQQRIRFGK
ncbi:homing endonuclease [Diplodia corticola]|uniref:Homing endonuclease n=1 Tax=Diplodia corticola TaxID=236234 RepID=A0A1J9QZW7_9PEZI|nr:homing endonuclease [Diplodia corticola]OJD33913.1 homing endonuclease [Diplodia corticola]